MTDLPAFFTALTGAVVGFGAVWWQHYALTWERLRAQGAELIFLGDQYYNGRFKPLRPYRGGGSNAERQQGYLDSMEAILRYLEVTAKPMLVFAASNFVAATHLSGGRTLDELGPAVAEEQYDEGRAALMRALSKKRHIRRLWWRFQRYTGRNNNPA